MAKRAGFATRLGAIAAAVGSAVGLGNIWRFPYEAGVNGGGAFILVYLVCILIMGIPVILSEFIIGRSTHSNMKAGLKQLFLSAFFSRFARMVIFPVATREIQQIYTNLSNLFV